MIDNITIGADPELFIVDKTNNKVISSVGLIPGKKGEPYVADNMPKGFGIEIDNILGEFNIPPTSSKEGFVNNIEYMKNYIDDFIKSKNPNYTIQCIASRMVDDDQLTSPEAREFGCSIDYNAYTRRANPKPKGTSTNLRSAGFHIHVGYDHPSVNLSLNLIKLFDIYLGIPSILIDKDTKRRSLYGKAGAFRLTKYGFEYRTLSSYLMSKKEYLTLIWDLMARAFIGDYSPSDFDQDKVQYIINNSDSNLAKEFLRETRILSRNPSSTMLRFINYSEI